ncbi:MAG: alpha-amylase/alpha-mannosidase, partial [Nitrospirae bacterium]|nr:alpha-amylase/alpha-mannosidase [Nitrospirota bacterium]
REQLLRARAYMETQTGVAPIGLWPSEGSVCQALIPFAAEAGFSWMASDEEILARSLGLPIERDGHGLVRAPERLYRPYWAVEGPARIAMIFRDHVLSDLIGFTYAGWEAEKAADDFVARLRAVRSACAGRVRAPIVPIILDGENAWEFYAKDGAPFLRALYGRLEREEGIVTTTVSAYLSENPPAESLPAVFPGSWINHNFKIWIGHEEDNLAWQWLAETRDVLAKRGAEADLPPAVREEAWRAIYAAEGSDWCWWYGDDHSSANDGDFDELFRSHLRRVYDLLDLRAPDGLWVPVLREERTVVPTTPCTAFVRPRIDGRVTHYYEWTSAARFDVKLAGGTMHHAGGLVSVLTYGFNATHWFVRLDFTNPPSASFAALGFVVHILRPRAVRCFISLADGPAAGQERRGRVRIENSEGETIREDAGEAVLDEILEAAVPFEALGFAPGDEVAFSIAVTDQGLEVERWPSRGAVSFTVPSADFEERMWRV